MKNKNPHPLLDKLKEFFKANSDSHIADVLEVTKPTISKIRTRTVGISDTMILAVHEATAWPISYIKQLRDETLTTPTEVSNGDAKESGDSNSSTAD